MLFQSKIDRALAHQAQRSAMERRDEDNELTPSDIMEKGDLPAMIIAGLVTLLPAALGALLLMCLAGWLFL